MTDKIEQSNKSSNWTIFALIFLAIIFNTNTSSFVVIMSDINQSFKAQGMTATQLSMIQTLPTLVCVPSIFLSGWLLTRISKKWICVIGWIIYGLCGLTLFFIADYRIFLVVRGMMGVGLGLVNPQSRSMIAHVLSRDKVAHTMGYLSMFGGFVSFTLAISMGYVASINWRLGLLVFPILTLIAVSLALAFVPTVPVEPKRATLIQEGKHEPLNKFVVAMWIAGPIVFCIDTVIQVKTSLYVRELGLGASTVSGWVAAASALGTFFGGFLFGFWHKRLRRWLFPVACMWSAFGYLILCTAHSIPQLLIGGFIVLNGSVGTLNPYLTSRVALAAPVSRKSMAITILTVGNFLGQFMATYYIAAMDKILGGSSAATLGSVGVSFIIIGICAGTFVWTTRDSNEKLMQSFEARVVA